MTRPMRKIRPVLLPASVLGLVLVFTIPLAGSEWYTPVRFVVSILGAIVAVMLLQYRLWFWVVIPATIAVVWNPVVVVPVPLETAPIAHIVAASAAALVAALARSREPEASGHRP